MSLVNSYLWTIFDTCTRPEYYQDLHNIVASPKGTIIRYEYREKYLSKKALNVAQSNPIFPSPALLVYAQSPYFQRKGKAPDATTSRKGFLWVATRLAQLRLISEVSDNYYFDIELMGYPNPDQDALMSLMMPLIAANDVPFSKWVSICENEGYNDLNVGDDNDNWKGIVERLGVRPSQFHMDAFWRVREIVGSNDVALQPAIKKELTRTDDITRTRRHYSQFSVLEGEDFRVDTVSFRPSIPNHENFPQHSLTVQVPDKDPIEITGPSVIALRQYTELTIKARAKRLEGYRGDTGHLVLETGKDEDGWPIGPNIKLLVSIEKNRTHLLFGSLFAVLAPVMILMASQVLSDNSFLAVILAMLGAVLGAIAYFLITGKIPTGE